MPPLRGGARLLLLILYVAGCHIVPLCLCASINRATGAAATLPDPAPLDPALVFPSSATPAQPMATGTIPAFPEQSDTVTSGATCALTPAPALLPAVRSSCGSSSDSGGALPPRLRCCPALAAWLFAAYAPAALAERRPASRSAAVDMPVPPNDSEACAGAADRALRAEGAALPRPPPGVGNGTSCDVAFCYCGVRLRRMACGPPAQQGGTWAPADEVARRLERDCSRPDVAGCSKCLRALSTIKPNRGGGAGKEKQASRPSEQDDRDCQLMGIMWLLQRNATRYGPAATAVIQALMAVDEASAAGVAASAGPSAACSLPAADDMPLPAEYAQRNGAAGAPGVCCFHLMLLLAALTLRVVYSL